MSDAQFGVVLGLAALCLWLIIRDDLRTRREHADDKLDALIVEALALAAEVADLDPSDESTPIYDRLAERRESFNRDLTRVHQLDTYQPDDWGGDTA